MLVVETTNINPVHRYRGTNPAQYLIAMEYLKILKEVAMADEGQKTVFMPYESASVLGANRVLSWISLPSRPGEVARVCEGSAEHSSSMPLDQAERGSRRLAASPTRAIRS